MLNMCYCFYSDLIAFVFPPFFLFLSRARRDMRGQALAWSEFAPQTYRNARANSRVGGRDARGCLSPSRFTHTPGQDPPPVGAHTDRHNLSPEGPQVGDEGGGWTTLANGEVGVELEQKEVEGMLGVEGVSVLSNFTRLCMLETLAQETLAQERGGMSRSWGGVQVASAAAANAASDRVESAAQVAAREVAKSRSCLFKRMCLIAYVSIRQHTSDRICQHTW